MPTGVSKNHALVKEWCKKKHETLQELHIRRWKTACEKGLGNQKIRDRMERGLKKNDWIDDAGNPKNMEENRAKWEAQKKRQREFLAKIEKKKQNKLD